MSRTIDVVTTFLGAAVRLGTGLVILGETEKPEKVLELYDFEACPYCRKVRDALTMLDLEAKIYPCPTGGTRFRPKVLEMGGKTQFPFFIDPNTESQLYESNDIIDYLFEEYGKGLKAPATLRFPPLTNTTSFLSSALRPLRGRKAMPSFLPPKPLELYSFEGSPYCRLVREVLCELELPYILRNVGKGGSVDYLLPKMRDHFAPEAAQTTENRTNFVSLSGKMQVPFLVDPNTNNSLFESADICDYLWNTYST